MSSPENKTRPHLLTWLCIFSFTTGVLTISMYLAIMIFSFNGVIPARLFPGLVLEYMHTGYLFILAMIVLAALGLTGVIMMWYLIKSGLYVYSSSKILTYFLPVLYIGNSHLTYPGLILTSFFIIFFGVALTNNTKTS